MNSRFHIPLFIVLACGMVASCKRDEADEIGGKGGNANLLITVKHHSTTVDSAMVYIKYNATDRAAFYDDSVRLSGPRGNRSATFSGLKNGKYFLYAYGYDPAIAENVEGGIPHTILEERSQDLSLPVTEAGH